MKKSIALLMFCIFGTMLISSCTTGSRDISSVDAYPVHSIYEHEHERVHLTNDH